jgi:Uma2 family endonuclease
MSTLAHKQMTVDEFLGWAEGRQGRWELHSGVPHAMSPERTQHVEVASPSTRNFDDTVKRPAYFSLPTVHHYVLVDPEGPPVVHYGRQVDGAVLRSLGHDGVLSLSPPGIEVPVAELLVAEP